MKNTLDFFINRIYVFLTKVNNESPLFGAVCLVSLVINIYLLICIDLIFFFNRNTNDLSNYYYYIFWIIIFVILYKYAIKNKKRIICKKVDIKYNYIVSLFLILTLVLFVLVANENRERIFKNKIPNENKPKKESLEGRIRKWFE